MHVTVSYTDRVAFVTRSKSTLGMRFRATVENIPIFFRQFIAFLVYTLLSLAGPGVIQAVEKLQKKCIIKFTQDEMHIICNDDANEGGIQVWS